MYLYFQCLVTKPAYTFLILVTCTSAWQQISSALTNHNLQNQTMQIRKRIWPKLILKIPWSFALESHQNQIKSNDRPALWSSCLLKVIVEKTDISSAEQQYNLLNILYLYPSQPHFHSCQKWNMYLCASLTKFYWNWMDFESIPSIVKHMQNTILSLLVLFSLVIFI